ncbi:hypothetical protein HDV04_003884 [Boothiomyces sp. JEL0838]|nr:hypothetical protein HDV04_003884 [Boothiomyces sp. JEL0838]
MGTISFLLLPSVICATSVTQLVPRSPGLFVDDTAYDRMAEFILVLLLAADLVTLAVTSKRSTRFAAIAYFVGVNIYYVIVMFIHLHVFSPSTNNALGVLASLFWWIFVTLIANGEFVQFLAIMKAVRPNQRFIIQAPRIIVTVGMFFSGLMVFMAYLSAYVQLPAIFDDLTLGNLVLCVVCIPRLFSTLWVLYEVRDIAKLADGIVRKLGKGYVRISGIQILNSLIGLVMLSPVLSDDGRFVSFIGSVADILINYAICSMLAAELSDSGNKEQISGSTPSKKVLTSGANGKD